MILNNYTIPIWNNRFTVQHYPLSDSRIIQIIPAHKGTDIIVFCENGLAYLLDGTTFEIMETYTLSKHRLSCVQEVVPRLKTRTIIVGDDCGNINSFNLSFHSPISFGQRAYPITAIQGLSDHRTLISYSDPQKGCRIEMISSITGDRIAHINLIEVDRIRDFACPEAFLYKNAGWLLAGSDTQIIDIGFNGRSLQEKSRVSIRDNFYLDELVCDVLQKQYVGKELIPLSSDETVYNNVPYARDVDEKRSTITLKDGVIVLSEDNNVYIKDEIQDIFKHVSLEEGVHFISQMHGPLGRIVLGRPDGRIMVVDYRRNSIRFILD